MTGLKGSLFDQQPSECGLHMSDGKSLEDSRGAERYGSNPRNWLGIVTTHRRLFEASQGGWLHPLGGDSVLGQRGFVSEDLSVGKNIVPVRLVFDVDKLPTHETNEIQRKVNGGMQAGSQLVIEWSKPIPLYATARIEVASIEHQQRLQGMANQFSNVVLPTTEIDIVESIELLDHFPRDARHNNGETVELPPSLDAIQGAMAMAIWGIPRISAWTEVLCAGLNLDDGDVAKRISKLDLHWLTLPWLNKGRVADGGSKSEQFALWQAAMEIFQSSACKGQSALHVAETIAQLASRNGNDRLPSDWLAKTKRLLSAQDQIKYDIHGQDGAGLAIQLVLLRPDPMKFKTWANDLPGLSPAIWWAATMLCGLRTGYRVLERHFRSESNLLNELIMSRALAQTMEVDILEVLPSRQHEAVKIRRNKDSVSLTWQNATLFDKKWRSRGRWDNQDLSQPAVNEAARELSRQLKWNCLEQCLHLAQGRYKLKGHGPIRQENNEMIVENPVKINVSDDTTIEKTVAENDFRCLLATGYGFVPDIPVQDDDFLTAKKVVPTSSSIEVKEIKEVPGLLYLPNFISETEEQETLRLIDAEEWCTTIKRRVQHYGWHYDYKKRRIDGSMPVNDMPQWAIDLAERLIRLKLISVRPDQMIVNEYCKDEGIGPHIDKQDDFAEAISTVSLLETWHMEFRWQKEKFALPLERRSVAIMTGDARYKWKHGLPSRKSEPSLNGKSRIPRGRRVSLTFRKVNRSK